MHRIRRIDKMCQKGNFLRDSEVGQLSCLALCLIRRQRRLFLEELPPPLFPRFQTIARVTLSCQLVASGIECRNHSSHYST